MLTGSLVHQVDIVDINSADNCDECLSLSPVQFEFLFRIFPDCTPRYLARASRSRVALGSEFVELLVVEERQSLQFGCALQCVEGILIARLGISNEGRSIAFNPVDERCQFPTSASTFATGSLW